MEERHEKLIRRFQAKKTELRNKRKELRAVRKRLIELKEERTDNLIAREFFIMVAQVTQEDIQQYLEDAASLAINIIPSDRPLKLLTKYVTRRNQPELDLFVQEGNYEPVLVQSNMDTLGNSVEELLSFASRLSLWYIKDPRPAPFQVHDEPFTILQKRNIAVAAEMVQKLAQRMGLQMIIISQEDELMNCADKVFEFTKSGGRSRVKEL